PCAAIWQKAEVGPADEPGSTLAWHRRESTSTAAAEFAAVAGTHSWRLFVLTCGADAVQVTVHPDLQLVGVLRAHPVTQFPERGGRSPLISLTPAHQRKRPIQPPAIGPTTAATDELFRHGVPPPPWTMTLMIFARPHEAAAAISSSKPPK